MLYVRFQTKQLIEIFFSRTSWWSKMLLVDGPTPETPTIAVQKIVIAFETFIVRCCWLVSYEKRKCKTWQKLVHVPKFKMWRSTTLTHSLNTFSHDRDRQEFTRTKIYCFRDSPILSRLPHDEEMNGLALKVPFDSRKQRMTFHPSMFCFLINSKFTIYAHEL